MNKKSHILITLAFLIALWILVYIYLKKTYFPLLFIAVAVRVSWAPDADQSFSSMGHRNWMFHSIIYDYILFLLVSMYNIPLLTFLFLLNVVVIGLHCLCDCRWQSRKRVGYYTVKIFMRPAFGFIHKESGKKIIIWKTLWGMNGACSTLWLVGNFLASLILLGAWLWLV